MVDMITDKQSNVTLRPDGTAAVSSPLGRRKDTGTPILGFAGDSTRTVRFCGEQGMRIPGAETADAQVSVLIAAAGAHSEQVPAQAEDGGMVVRVPAQCMQAGFVHMQVCVQAGGEEQHGPTVTFFVLPSLTHVEAPTYSAALPAVTRYFKMDGSDILPACPQDPVIGVEGENGSVCISVALSDDWAQLGCLLECRNTVTGAQDIGGVRTSNTLNYTVHGALMSTGGLTFHIRGTDGEGGIRKSRDYSGLRVERSFDVSGELPPLSPSLYDEIMASIGILQGQFAQLEDSIENGDFTQYIHMMYAPSADGTGMTSQPAADSKYLGVYSGDSASAPADPAAYTWMSYVGPQGEAALSAELDCCALAVAVDGDGKALEDVDLTIGGRVRVGASLMTSGVSVQAAPTTGYVPQLNAITPSSGQSFALRVQVDEGDQVQSGTNTLTVTCADQSVTLLFPITAVPGNVSSSGGVTDLGTQSLDGVVQPGMYYQPTAANCTYANGYPTPYWSGYLTVSTRADGQTVQTWKGEKFTHPSLSASGFTTTRGRTFSRVLQGGAWSAWVPEDGWDIVIGGTGDCADFVVCGTDSGMSVSSIAQMFTHAPAKARILFRPGSYYFSASATQLTFPQGSYVDLTGVKIDSTTYDTLYSGTGTTIQGFDKGKLVISGSGVTVRDCTATIQPGSSSLTDNPRFINCPNISSVYFTEFTLESSAYVFSHPCTVEGCTNWYTADSVTLYSGTASHSVGTSTGIVWRVNGKHIDLHANVYSMVSGWEGTLRMVLPVPNATGANYRGIGLMTVRQTAGGNTTGAGRGETMVSASSSYGPNVQFYDGTSTTAFAVITDAGTLTIQGSISYPWQA